MFRNKETLLERECERDYYERHSPHLEVEAAAAEETAPNRHTTSSSHAT